MAPATVLLVHADGTNGSTAFVDSSAYASTLVASGTMTVSTTSPKFGTGSADTGASASSARIAVALGSASLFNFKAGQFTIEAWIYFKVTPSGSQAIISQWSSAPNLAWTFRMNSGALAFFYSTTGSDFPGVSATFTPALNTWYHVAVDRDASNVMRVYVDGAVIASATVSSSIFDSTSSCYVGNEISLTRGFPGRLDEVRVTNGLARYGGAFTPPTMPFSPYDADGPIVSMIH